LSVALRELVLELSAPERDASSDYRITKKIARIENPGGETISLMENGGYADSECSRRSLFYGA
jgi:hypothetical protein